MRYAQLVMGPAGSGKVRRLLRSAPAPMLPSRSSPHGRRPPLWTAPLLQSTYCKTVQQHCEAIGRTVHVVNFDPAAEVFNYEPSIGARRAASPATWPLAAGG